MTAPRVLVCGYSEVGTACLEALLDLVADAPVEAGLPRVIHTPQAGHFHHAKPRGILENLRGHAMEVPLPRA